MKKLNLGCGYDLKEGYINIDISPEVGADVVHNLNDIPYPFKDNTFDYIYAKDVLEHLIPHRIPEVIDELYRISNKGAKWFIKVPFYNNRMTGGNILHFRGFDTTSFDKYDVGHKISHYTNTKLKILSAKLESSPRGKLVPFSMFLRHSIGELYTNVVFELEVVK